MFTQQERLDSLIKLWELLLSKSAEKGRMLLFTQKRVHFLHETEEVMSWILEKVGSCLHPKDWHVFIPFSTKILDFEIRDFVVYKL